MGGMGMGNHIQQLIQMAFNSGMNSGYENATKQSQDQGNKKNLVFRTGAGITKNVQISYGQTVGDALKLFLRMVGQGELIDDTTGKIVFLFNAQNIDVNNKEIVEKFFKGVTPTIVVNDVGNLIGA